MPEAFMADMRHPGNRLSEDTHFYYQYDAHGNLSQKVSKRDAGEVHHYRYDRSHRLVSYLCAQDGEAVRGGRYCYDPLGRRIGKQVMNRNQPKHISWFGWDGDKLVLTERDGTRIHTVYLPHSFVPLLRFEGDKPPTIAPLADKLEQEAGITLPLDFKHTLHHIELALRANRLSAEQHAWLNQVQLINLNGHIDWSITLDAWGNALSEENPHQLHQPIRMQGQQYDEESGLHYNRHRYYDPIIGRYITQDPIGLSGGFNLYSYAVNPVQFYDPLGLAVCKALFPDYPIEDSPGKTSAWLGGHGGVLGYDNKGVTRYYEYGRYAPSTKGIIGSTLPCDDGNVRKVTIPNLTIGSDGNPTKESWNKLKKSLSAAAEHNTPVELTCSQTADQQAAYDYAVSVANNKERDKYDWNPFSSNQCRTF
ncbi:MAG: RHS repeat-associated core domain-containing protein [Hafnia alvei]